LSGVDSLQLWYKSDLPFRVTTKYINFNRVSVHLGFSKISYLTIELSAGWWDKASVKT